MLFNLSRVILQNDINKINDLVYYLLKNQRKYCKNKIKLYFIS